MEKVHSIILTMNIGYHLIDSPFKYHVSHLNGNLNYTPSNHKLVNLFGTLTGAASKSINEIKLSVPIDDGGARGFDYTLEAASDFDNTFVNYNLYNFLVEQVCSAYQKHVLHNADYQNFWTQMEETTIAKNGLQLQFHLPW